MQVVDEKLIINELRPYSRFLGLWKYYLDFAALKYVQSFASCLNLFSNSPGPCSEL